MLRAAEEFAEEDKGLKETVDAKNKLESAAYSLKNQLNNEIVQSCGLHGFGFHKTSEICKLLQYLFLIENNYFIFQIVSFTSKFE